ncbi:hypothetical protein TRICI_002430 [Trichomonascus ciferrii]|uniref:Uncharacterized protein n=1 Tax=Trichomonascus ciferrii TaxID=44093 RepID=A0A642V5Z3_9ASCO|nr:hypothetical protein TRICI_002430 [Trichomonascus ciferrii]
MEKNRLDDPFETPSEGSNSSIEEEWETVEDRNIVSQALVFCDGDSPPLPGTTPRLKYPVVIPQITRSMDPLFMRAHAPALEAKNISRDQFVNFLDGLNMAASPNVYLEALNIAGSIVSWIPTGTTVIAGTAVSLAATGSGLALSIVRVKRFLRKANECFFAPRDLHAQIVSAKQLADYLGIDSPLDIVPALKPDHIKLSVQERRLLGIQNHISALDFELPPTLPQEKLVNKFSSKRIQWAVHRREKRLLKSRARVVRASPWYKPGTDMVVPMPDEKSQKSDQKLEQKLTQDPTYVKLLRRFPHRECKDKERLQGAKIKWLVITNADQSFPKPPKRLSIRS